MKLITLNTLVAACWAVYQLFQCPFFFAAVNQTNHKMHYASSCSCLDKPEVRSALHACLVPPTTTPVQLALAGTERHGSSHEYTQAAAGKSKSQWDKKLGKIREMIQALLGQPSPSNGTWRIITGWGYTGPGSSRNATENVQVMSYPSDVEEEFEKNSSRGVVLSELLGSTVAPPALQYLRGEQLAWWSKGHWANQVNIFSCRL